MDCFYSGMKKSLTALAFGTLGLGIAEFVMMGILPDVAKDLHISIPQAGHFISAYALGVCVGAPGMVLVARTRPLKHILLGLMVIYICGNLCAAVSVNYWMMLMMRLFPDCLMAPSLGLVPLWRKEWLIKEKVRRQWH